MKKRIRTPLQCAGQTRAGKRCSITGDCNMKDASGAFIAEPLKNGASCCKLHLRIFCARPARVEDPLLLYLDFETTGLDILRDHIVEIGVLCEHSECFSTVVCPPTFADGPTVHGIPDEELREGPCFRDAFGRLLRFCRNLAENAVTAGDSSEEEEARPPTLKDAPPQVVIVAHNGVGFDFPFLCSECYRNDILLESLCRWRFVDSLEVVRAIDDVGGCVKLQCLLRHLAREEELRAHRALDDCFALRAVLSSLARWLGVSPWALLRPFVLEFDSSATLTNLCCS